MLTTYFKAELKEQGFVDMDIQYSLSYCQGDGVAFSGNLLNRVSLNKLLPRLIGELATTNELEQMAATLMDYRRYEVLCIERNDHRYSHEYTMFLSNSVEFSGLIDDMDDQAGAGVTPEVLARWDSLWMTFVTRLSADIVRVSKQLRDHGYAIIENSSREDNVIREFRTRDWVVQFRETPVDLCDFRDWTPEEIKALVDGNSRLVNLLAVVKTEDGTQLAGEAISGVGYLTTDKTYGGMFRPLCSQAIKEARQYAGRLLRSLTPISTAA
ncbi:hypothetical protein [Aeromonas sp. Y311-2]|uniref:hypothetical protein n=1 Tax=Aeromonas sp. Y311-2 TaxID=2990507 RepID=UPI0022E67137|nr:hypothetical protein [Aeromonas sp. Y311-2]